MIHPFDLQARAELAARSLTALTDDRREGLMYFVATWRTRPPRADHCLWDCGDGTGRHIDALSLVRGIVRPGSPEAHPTPAELRLERWMMRFLGEQGLSWLLEEPFARPFGVEMLLRDYEPADVCAEISWAQRGTLLGLTSRFRATGDERFKTAGVRMVDGLLAVAVTTPEGLYYPEGYYRKGGWKHHGGGLYPGIEEYNAALIVAAVRFWRATGYEPALRLAEGLVTYALKHTIGYHPDGRLYPGEGVMKGQGTLDHFHTRSNFLLGVLETGLVTGRRELVAWARQSYESAKRWGTDFGWFPEGMGHRHGETCCITDMIEAAILLGRHVSRATFADAERFGRNHLMETQYLSLEMLQQAVMKLPEDPSPLPSEGLYSTDSGVAESQIGAFAARSTLNDALHPDAPAMMQCCNAAGARALYDLWRYATEDRAVHMRFSVQTEALRVVCHEPTRGCLEITAREAGPVSVRLPEGVRHAVAADTAGTRALYAVDGYVVTEARAGKVLTLYYDLPERTAAYTVGTPGKTASCVGRWLGETLVSVDPPGELYPLYRRAGDHIPVQPELPAAPPLAALF